MMQFSILNVSVPHSHLSEVLLSSMKISFRGPSQPEEPAPICSGLIIFPLADLLFHRSVTSDLCQHFPSRTSGEEDSPIRNNLIVPNWELLEQIRYSSINLPFLSPFNICCLNTMPKTEVFCHMLLKIYYLINQMCNPVREWDQLCVIQPIF